MLAGRSTSLQRSWLSGAGVAWNIGARICVHVGNNMGCWAIGEVMVVKMVGRRSLRNEGRLKVLKLFSCRDNSSFRLNSLGLLCLLQSLLAHFPKIFAQWSSSLYSCCRERHT